MKFKMTGIHITGLLVCASVLLLGCSGSVSELRKSSKFGIDNGAGIGGKGSTPVPADVKDMDRGVLSRNTGVELIPQFKAVFPNKNIAGLDYSIYKKLVRDGGVDPDFEKNNPSIKPLNDPSRPIGVAAQLAWERVVDDLCKVTTKTGDENSNELFVENDDMLLGPGESYPADAVVKKIFVATRRAWRSPFKAEAPQITSLVTIYKKAKDALGESGADQALCEAVLLAPQFWLGAGGNSEPVRKIYLRLAGRLPTIKEIASYLNKSTTLEKMVSDIQTKESDAYLQAIWYWHDWQYGFSTNMNSKVFGDVRAFAPYAGTNGASSSVYSQWDGSYPGWSWMIHADDGDFSSPALRANGAGCDGGPQEFDPRTVGMAWYFGPQLLARHMDRAAGDIPAGDYNGTANGQTFFPFDFIDIRSKVDCVNQGKNDGHCESYSFRDEKFKNAFGTEHSNNEAIRAYRITPNGELQNGRSTVKAWFGGSVQVCNSVMRPLLTCAGAKPADIGALTGGSYINSLGCQKADLAAIRSTSVSYTVPSTPIDGNFDRSKLNDVIIGFPAVLYGRNADRNLDSAGPVVHPYAQVTADLHAEPRRFIQYLIKNNRDYRDLIRGNYTIGSPAYKLFIATNGMPMAAYPAGFEKYYDDANRDELNRHYSEAEIQNNVIKESEFSAFSANAFIKDGVNAINQKKSIAWDPRPFTNDAIVRQQVEDANKHSFWNSKSEFHVRPFSGILTMPAFIQPVSGKSRTYAARVFQRVMCRLPSEVPIPAGAYDKHLPFVPTSETGGKQHVDPKKGCVSCHINMDPLAAALSPAFMSRIGQLSEDDNLGELISSGDPGTFYNGWRWGSPNSRGSGYFQGKKISGYKEMGEAVSDSDEFADCAVSTAFKNLYGRSPTQLDLKVIELVKSNFKNAHHYNYNAMIIDLVKSNAFTTSN